MKNRKPIWNVRRNDLGNVTVKARETGLAIVHDGTTYDEAHVFATMGRLELTLRSTRAIVLPVTGDLFCQSPAGWHQAGQLEAVARGVLDDAKRGRLPPGLRFFPTRFGVLV